jgi:hypothetical protein
MCGDDKTRDELFDDAVKFVRSEGKCQTLMLQRHFRIGFGRAIGLVEEMEREGIVSRADGKNPRRLLPAGGARESHDPDIRFGGIAPAPELEILDCGLDWAVVRGRPLSELGIAEIAIIKTDTGEQVGTIEGFTVIPGKPLVESIKAVAKATCPPGCHVLIRGVEPHNTGEAAQN